MNRLNRLGEQTLIFAAFFAVSPFVASDARATPIVDQQQSLVDSTVGGLAIGGDSEQMLAQVVTAGITGVLTEVRLPVGGDSGDLIVEIQGVAGGVPDGVVLTSASFPVTTLPPSLPSTFISLPLDSPAAFLAGDTFAIVLRSMGSFGLFQGPSGNPYPGGDAFFDARPNQPGWVPTGPPTFDLPFQTVVEPTAVPEPATMWLVGSVLAFVGIRSRRLTRAVIPGFRRRDAAGTDASG